MERATTGPVTESKPKKLNRFGRRLLELILSVNTNKHGTERGKLVEKMYATMNAPRGRVFLSKHPSVAVTAYNKIPEFERQYHAQQLTYDARPFQELKTFLEEAPDLFFYFVKLARVRTGQ